MRIYISEVDEKKKKTDAVDRRRLYMAAAVELSDGHILGENSRKINKPITRLFAGSFVYL